MNIKMSKREYECVESVRSLSSGGWPARVKDIATMMKVRPPTALGFLDRLVEMSLIEKGPIGYRLSQYGVAYINQVTRAHRLFETLLSNAGIPLDEACRASSSIAIEGDIDDEAIKTLSGNLGHPGICPHGNPIPADDMGDERAPPPGVTGPRRPSHKAAGSKDGI
ncbi:MAG: metal-dependent transcriptional regulator [Nitrososphaerota archaeon]|jgi:Mn-dependent DtxR family transcriptional regulator|nr:metal-dependent transcriptional regulator [Nitrososphaerota archaeon]